MICSSEYRFFQWGWTLNRRATQFWGGASVLCIDIVSTLFRSFTKRVTIGHVGIVIIDLLEVIVTKKRIKDALRQIIKVIPGGTTLLRRRTTLIERRRLARIGNAKEVFLHHYEAKTWGDDESVSGAGSTIRYTENIRKIIPHIVDDLGALVILDAPCGDYNWFRMIEWERQIAYIGGDIVEPLVQQNESRFGSESRKFITLDIVHDSLPSADLWLCRDCLFHLSNRDIFLVLNNFIGSGIPYILTSTHPKCDRNDDIPTGSFRLINLQLPPFSLGKPVQVIDDWIEGFPVRQLALWKRKVLRNHLASNKEFQHAVRDHR